MHQRSKKTAKRFDKRRRLTCSQKDYKTAFDIGRTIWGTGSFDAAVMERIDTGHMYADTYHDHLHARHSPHHLPAYVPQAFSRERNAAESLNLPDSDKRLDNIFASICAGREHPNEEQRKFLEHFLRRLKLEVLEQQQDRVN